MTDSQWLHLHNKPLEDIRGKIPEEDYINSQFDVARETRPSKLLLLLGTPRSGSTYLCGLLKANNICLPHEYFQPWEYMPLLAERWQCLSAEGGIDKQKYLRELIKHRTYESGVLGINLHADHLSVFRQFEDALPDIPVEIIHLIRRDTIKQAISYDIAKQTDGWSSHFEKRAEPTYNYEAIRQKADTINSGNLLISAYAATRGIPAKTIYYEDLVISPAQALGAALGISDLVSDNTGKGLKRQSGPLNDQWAKQFAADLVQQETTKPGKRKRKGRKGKLKFWQR